ncbi:MAG: cytochrome P460 family protein [Kofleriaceae bacterium]
MTRSLAVLTAFAGACASNADSAPTRAPSPPQAVRYAPDGALLRPTGFRGWAFLGAMVTPNGLNAGKAGFPEFHNVYLEPDKLDAYHRTGKFPEGTIIVKELVLTRNPTYPDGSTDEASGRGFFEGEPNGLDVMVKDSRRYADTRGWGFFNFGHHARPYAASAKAAPADACADCHDSGAAETDQVWIQFYPNLRAE